MKFMKCLEFKKYKGKCVPFHNCYFSQMCRGILVYCLILKIQNINTIIITFIFGQQIFGTKIEESVFSAT